MKFKIIQATVAGTYEQVTDDVETDSVGEFHLDAIAYASHLGDMRGTMMLVITPVKDDN